MSEIVAAVQSDDGFPCYEVPDGELGPGASMGNGHAWVNTGTDGRIQDLFCADVGCEVAGPLMVRYGSAETRVACRGEACRRANVPLKSVDAGRFLIHPLYQRHTFDLPGGLAAEETVFVPRGEGGLGGDRAAACYVVEVENRGEAAQGLSVYALCRLRGGRRTPRIRGRHDEESGALLAHEPDENPDWVRTLACTRPADAWSITDDFGAFYDTDVIPRLEGRTDAEGDVLGCLEVRLELEPGQRERLAFILAFTDQGEAAAREQLGELRGVDEMLATSLRLLKEELAPARVFTPDPVINAGAFWAKVNMLRVLAHYPQGEAFTNEPGVSSNVVARDVVWFIYGCDHFRPESSRRMLDALVRLQYPSGKIPEYYNAVTGEVEDYGLNINDGTPLFVLAVNHHVRSTGDFEYLGSIYDSVAKASRYITSQRDERGLVYCDADGVEVWGICSWRNVIPNYRINGAVTEVNAECAAALRAMMHMAQNIGRDEDAAEFRQAAADLGAALNEHLLDQERQLYLLNIDREGRRRTAVTADELFPVLYRKADEDVAFRIIRRLNSPDFWTSAGIRTVSRDDPLYDPTRYVGLLGGVWPGLTWWYAFAAARYHPEFMVQALHNSYAHYCRHPRVFNTVPGQFSEWFDGESLINRGMRLSPWEPPRFLWAAVEGICGIMVSPDEPGINPLIPPDWKWASAVGVCYHGRRITAFAGRRGGGMLIYANAEFRSKGPHEVLPRDLTESVHARHGGVHPVALADEERTVVALGSCREEAVTTPVDLHGALDGAARYSLRQYSSERGEWGPAEEGTGAEFATVGARIEAEGYHVFEFTRT